VNHFMDDTIVPKPKKGRKREEDVVYELAGSWKDNRSVEEMIDDIHASKTMKWKTFMRGVNGFSDDFMAEGRLQ